MGRSSLLHLAPLLGLSLAAFGCDGVTVPTPVADVGFEDAGAKDDDGGVGDAGTGLDAAAGDASTVADGGTSDAAASDGGTGNGPCPTRIGTSICDLRHPRSTAQITVGTAVTVDGVEVTTDGFVLPDGKMGFYVQDVQSIDEGRYSGILAVLASEVAAPAIGNLVVLQGQLEAVTAADGTVLRHQLAVQTVGVSGSSTPTPRVVSAADLATTGAEADAYEGVLVEVANVSAAVVTGVQGAAGSTLVGAVQLSEGLILRDTFTPVVATVGQSFPRVAGIAWVGTTSSDRGIHFLSPRSPADITGDGSGGITSISMLQDPSASGRPAICEQDGGTSARIGTCPAVQLDDVVVTAAGTVGSTGRVSFWVQDPRVTSGRFAGVRVFSAQLSGSTSLSIGDRVSVMGLAVLYYDGIQVADGTVTVTGSGTPIAATVVQPSDIPGTPTLSNGEVVSPYEGVLVRIDDVTVTERCVDSSGDRGLWSVTGGVIIGSEFDYAYNGSYDGNGTCTEMTRTGDSRRVGDTFRSITGVVDYTFGQLRLTPRDDNDLVRN